MTFDLGLIWQALPEVLAALWVTVWVWAVATLCGVALGFAVAALRRYGPAPLAWALRAAVEALRGTPFLVQIFLLYFGGPFVGLRLEPIPAGLIGLSLYAAAYFSEIFRGGFEAVPKGHVEAAACVGLTPMQTLRRIVLPEMTVLTLPQCVNMAILLIKETAILSIITVPELTMIVGAIGSQQYAFVEAMFLLALFYWALVELCGWLGRRAEARLAHLRFAA